MSDVHSPSFHSPKRIDLHCHSSASTEADEALLLAIHCPESYSSPEEVEQQARRRGMDFVTLTDHDTLNGVLTLLDKPGVLSGEELTCYFPEDGCKMHVLVWGLNPDQHNALQAMNQDIYQCARYIQQQQLAHAVAHPMYRQNDLLERWHLERLILLFKGFECLNGAHSNLHREAFEPMLDELTRERLYEYAAKHRIDPLWPEPWIKARTGGSDDHGLFNIGRTWTEFPADIQDVPGILECLRTARCRPGGEAGSSIKLAHNFISVGVRYFNRQFLSAAAKPSMPTLLLNKLVGENQRYRKRDLLKMAVTSQLKRAGKVLPWPLSRKKAKPTGTAMLMDLFNRSFAGRLAEHRGLTDALSKGLAPLGEHETMFKFLSAINRDIAQGIASSVSESLKQASLGDVFDVLSSVAAHQFVMLPYYFALFHQNRERHLLGRLTGHRRQLNRDSLRIGLFTDTFDEINGVGRFIRDLAGEALHLDRKLIVHTCVDHPRLQTAYRKNFVPMTSSALPFYPDLPLVLPPVAEVLEWADRQQFDAIHVDTPGPMGLCGLLVAKMLRVPVLGTYHTDFPAYVKTFTGDYRLTSITASYMKFFYDQCDVIYSRSREYETVIKKMGFNEQRVTMIPPMVDTAKFQPIHRDETLWPRLGVREANRLLYVGRISTEKNLPMLAETFKRLCRQRHDVALILAGDGPYRAAMEKELQGLPAYFLGVQNDAQLSALYASADLFVFPSRTDTLGQVVMEAQASGLPVLVSDEGGPKEMMDDGITGFVLPATKPLIWVEKIHQLLADTSSRARMGRTAAHRMQRFALDNTFEAWWNGHVQAALDREATENQTATPVESGRYQTQA